MTRDHRILTLRSITILSPQTVLRFFQKKKGVILCHFRENQSGDSLNELLPTHPYGKPLNKPYKLGIYRS